MMHVSLFNGSVVRQLNEVFFFLIPITQVLHAKTRVESCVNIMWETLEMGSTESCVLLEIKTGH